MFWTGSKNKNGSQGSGVKDVTEASLPVQAPEESLSRNVLQVNEAKEAGGLDQKETSTRTINWDSEEDLGRIRSAIGSGTVIQGKLSFDKPVKIDGKLTGQVISTDLLVIGPEGFVDAEVRAGSLMVFGKLAGNIKITGRLYLRAGSEVDGEIAAAALLMEEGAIFNGNFSYNTRTQVRELEVKEVSMEEPEEIATTDLEPASTQELSLH